MWYVSFHLHEEFLLDLPLIQLIRWIRDHLFEFDRRPPQSKLEADNSLLQALV